MKVVSVSILQWSIGFTLGASKYEPVSLEDALGQKLTAEDLRKCFSCHATNAVSETQELRLEGLIPGVSCEACHGPAAAHVEAAKEGKSKTVGVFSPAKMAGNELSQRFCGSCHRSHEEVMAMPDLGGAGNIRFQPYRLAKSACYYGNPADRRISCIACHDPHAPLAREPACMMRSVWVVTLPEQASRRAQPPRHAEKRRSGAPAATCPSSTFRELMRSSPITSSALCVPVHPTQSNQSHEQTVPRLATTLLSSC